MARSAAATRCSRALAHPLNHQLGEFCGGPGDVGAFFSVPIRCCVAHAENCERREPGIQIGTEFPLTDALLDDVLEYALESARPSANTTTAFPGKMLTLIEEDPDEVGPIPRPPRALARAGGWLSRWNKMAVRAVSEGGALRFPGTEAFGEPGRAISVRGAGVALCRLRPQPRALAGPE